MSKRAGVAEAVEASRAEALDAFLKEMNREKPGEVLRMDDPGRRNDIEVIPTGAISLDVALGCGGFPRGRIVELYGQEMSGKTSLALSAAGVCQRAGGVVGFVDAEHALDVQHALDMGVDPHTMVIYQPSSGEDGLSMVERMTKSRAFDMVIIDSVAALTPEVELNGEMSDQQVGAHARLMSKGLRKLTGIASETNTTLVFINQIRMMITSYGDPRTTTGGKALKFYASVRIEVSTLSKGKLMEGTRQIGQTCIAKVVKNKCGAPFQSAEYDLLFGKGIQSEGSLLDVAERVGVVSKSGATYVEVATGERIGVGKEKCKAAVADDPELAERLTVAVYAALAGVPDAAPSVDGEMPAEVAAALAEEDRLAG